MDLLQLFPLLLEVMLLLFKTLLFVIESTFRLFISNASKSVKEEIVLITGAGSGLGKELALLFAQFGATLVLWDINLESLEAVSKQIKKNDGNIYIYQCDVTNDRQVETLAHCVRRDVGDVTILVNNAGILHGQQLMCLNNHQIRRTLEVNLLSHFWTTREFLPRMLELNHGHIVAISSIAGCRGCVNMTDYSASKFGIYGFMNSLEEELIVAKKEHSIMLTTVFPVAMDTGLCQRPRTRFPWIFPILNPHAAAKAIANGILKNKRMIFVPSRVEFLVRISGLFPIKVAQMFQQFFDYSMSSNTRASTDVLCATNMKRIIS